MIEAYQFQGAPKLYTLNIEKFRGVDFANSPLTVETYRSPDALNMISDLAGFPVSRTGYTSILQVEGRINGIYTLETAEVMKRVVHHGTKLSLWENDTATVIYSNMKDEKSTALQMNQRLWIFDGKKALCFGEFDGEYSVKPISDLAYVPTTVISRTPQGGGTSLEDVNLLQPKRINSFLCTAEDKTYQLQSLDIDSAPVTARKLDSSGSWINLTENTDFTVDRSKGQVTFQEAPGESPVSGMDNLEITYSKTVEGYANRIDGCNVMITYGVEGAADRFFVTGNPDYPNMDWYSASNDPTYFSDLNYSVIGQDSTAIMGYSRLADGSLAVHKERNGIDPTVFNRTGTIIDNKAVFPIRQGSNGVGVVAKRAFANLVNDPLILSSQGVYAVIPVNNAAVNERYAQSRSYFVNPVLIKEPNLKDAEAIEMNGFYYLAVNGNVYVADSRQKSYVDRADGDQYQYEWYFWKNVPVRVFWENEGVLHFGTEGGDIMKFLPDGERDSYFDMGEPILCYWKTPILNLDSFTNYKTLKNAFAVPNPYLRSEINIDYIVKSIPKTVKTSMINIFDFNDIDFSEFTFDTDSFPRIIPTNLKQKKFMLIQLRLWSESGKPFGFYALTLSYTLGGKFKG